MAVKTEREKKQRISLAAMDLQMTGTGDPAFVWTFLCAVKTQVEDL